MALPELGEFRRVGVDLRIGEGGLGLSEDRLDLVEPGYQPGVHQLSVGAALTVAVSRTANATGGIAPRSMTSSAVSSSRATMRLEIATSIWDSSGTRVVSFWSQMPGAAKTFASHRRHGCRPAQQLVGDPGDHRDPDQSRDDEKRPSGTAEHGEEEDRAQDHDQKERGPASRMLGRIAAHRFDARAAGPPRRRGSTCARRRDIRRHG